MENWIRLARFGDQSDFILSQTVLDAHQIKFILQNLNTYSLDTLSTDLGDKAVILVHRMEYAEAKNALIENGYGKYLIED